MFFQIGLCFNFLNFALQLNYDCFNHSIVFEKHLYLSSPSFPRGLAWEERPNCFFEFKNPQPILLIFTNALLCDVMIKTNENETLIPVLDSNAKYFQFEGTFLSMFMLPNSTQMGSNCEWQAFQAFAYDPANNFNIMASEIFDESLIFAVSTFQERTWNIYNDLEKLIYLKMIIGYNISRSDQITVTAGHTYVISKDEYLTSPRYYSEYERHHDIVLHCAHGCANNLSFYFFATIGKKELGWNSDCVFKNINGNKYEFSNYDKIYGYKNNMRCTTLINKTEGFYYKLRFEKHHIENYFDNVTIETEIDVDLTTLGNSSYIVPYTNFLLRFASDNSIVQAGFILNVERYACDCGDSLIIVPCDGKILHRNFLNTDDPVVFCDISCIFQIKLEENCTSNFFTVYYNLHPVLDIDNRKCQYTDFICVDLSFYSSEGSFVLADHRMMHYYDPIVNYSLIQTIPNYFRLIDVMNFEFWLNFKIPLNLEFMTIVLNSTNWVFYDILTSFNKTMTTVKIDPSLQAKNYTVQLFVSYHGPWIVRDLDIYSNSMKDYHGSFYHLATNDDTRSMSFQQEFSFYFETFYPKDEALLFIRIKELDVENCLFEHNILDFLALSLEDLLPFTMVNNGTGVCKTTMFNIGNFYKFDIGMYAIWTNSKENVILLNSRHKLVVKFNYATVHYVQFVEFNDLLFELYLPPHASVTMRGFLVL